MRHLFLLLALFPAGALHAWDYEGHRTVNRLALASLPTDFPAFVREPAAAERIAFLSGEPDRWRNNGDLPIRHANGPDHFLDLEHLTEAGLDPATISCLRQVFAADFAAGRAAHPAHFPAIDPAKNSDRTREWPGFLPWAVAEHYGKLKSAFSYLKTFEESGGTAEEIANARANIIYTMGVMGHYIGDGAQPLHTTKHHNGWVGENPQDYTTWPRFHSWIDSGFINKAGITYEALAPRVTLAQPLALGAAPGARDPLFVAVMDWFLQQHAQVETLYQMEKAGKLSNEREKAERTSSSFPGPVDPAGRAFMEGRLLSGGEMLAKLWVTAWQSAPVDTYLRSQLARRQGRAASEAK